LAAAAQPLEGLPEAGVDAPAVCPTPPAQADTEVKPGDHLVVVGPTARIKAFAALY
jgi:hypothetical protein